MIKKCCYYIVLYSGLRPDANRRSSFAERKDQRKARVPQGQKCLCEESPERQRGGCMKHQRQGSVAWVASVVFTVYLSQNASGGTETQQGSSLGPYSEQGFFQSQIMLSRTRSSCFKNLQGWRLHNLSVKPVPIQRILLDKIFFFPSSNENVSCSSLQPVLFLVLSLAFSKCSLALFSL